MICPATPVATASGLMMVSVRSAGIRSTLSFSPENTRHGGAHVSGAFDGGDAGDFHGRHLLRGRALAAGDDGAGMTHAEARRRGLPADEADHRLLHMRSHEGRRLLLRGAADLADHHDGLGLGIVLEEAEDVDEAGAIDGIAADPDAGRLAEAALGELVDHLVGERAAARDHAHRPLLVDVARHDSDLGPARRDDARAVGPDESTLGALQEGLDLDHIIDRHALGDADDERDLGVGGFHDGVGGGRRRNEDQRTVGAAGSNGFLDGVPHGKPLVGGAAFARRDAAHDLGAVFLAAQGVESALFARDPLHQHPRGLIHEDAHGRALLANSTTFFAPEPMSSALTKLRPDSASIFLPCSTLVPSTRTTTGSLSPSFLTAAIRPSASRSPRRMPPKTLMNTALTLGSEERMRKAFSICSGEAPPPTSRKLAGSPPASLMMSMVAMARPAPLTMQPTFPSSLM